MKIKKVILKGFKSFLDKTEIIFSPRITIAVGPNGCGKTNIFEGILFALGEKKLQNLRGNAWQDLIFSGNEKIRGLGVAEVAIIMGENEEEIEIRRKIYKDGKIENYINGEYISHLKWNDKLYEIFPKGNGYALFKNEDIEKFIMDASRFLKEFIHSGAGIELFEKKKETLKRRLLKVQREVVRIEDILRERERRIDELEKEVERLKIYWEIKDRISYLEKMKLSISYFNLKKEIAKKEKEKEKYIQEMMMYKEKEKEYESVISNIKEKISLIDENIKNIEEKENELLQKEKDIIIKKTKFMEEKKNLILQKEDMEKRRKNLLNILNEIRNDIEKISIKDFEFDEENFKKLSFELKSLQNEILKLEREKEKLNLRKFSLEENIKILKERIKENKEKFEKEKEKEFSLKNEIEVLLEKIKERENLNDENIKKLRALNEEIEKRENEILNIEVNLKNLLAKLKYVEEEINLKDEKIFLNFIDKDDERNLIFEKIFFYPVLSYKDILSEKKQREKFLIEEKIKDFINSQISKISKVENLKEFLKDVSKLEEEKIYITEDEYLIEKGFIVEKIKKETILKIKEREEIKRKIEEEKEKINKILEENKKMKEEREILKKRIEEIDKKILEEKKNLRIKESEYEIVNFNLKNFENRINNGGIEIENTQKEMNFIKEEIYRIQKEIKEKERKKEEIEKEYEKLEVIFKEKEKLNYLKKMEERTLKEIEEVEGKIKEIDEKYEFILKEIDEILKEEEEFLKVKEKIKEEKEKILKEKKEIEEEKEKILEKIKENEKKIEMVKEEIFKIDAKIENLKEKILEFPPDLEEISSFTPVKKIDEELELLKKRLFEFHDVNLAAEKEYNKEKEEYNKMNEALKDVKISEEKIKEGIKILDEEAKRRFWNIYNGFKNNLKDVAKYLLEGDVYIELENPSDPLNSEFIIKASPYGKRIKSIPLLSGGERALLALTIIFSLYKTSPAPFCILDEVDAALDDANTLKFVNFIKNLSSNTQFFIITHNKRTMEAAEILYGVSMEDGISKVFSLKLEK